MALYMFHGEGCPHCVEMVPVVDKLNQSGEFKIEKLETWHNKENEAKQKEFDKGFCEGVPFFYNTDSGEWICGGTDEETLKKWAKGEKLSS